LDFSNPLTQRILEALERRVEIAPNTITPDQYSYSPEDDFYPPPSYSPVTYEDLDPSAIPLEIPQIEVEILLVNLEIEHSYFFPETYGFPRDEINSINK